jgi:hypothetical protein
MESTSSFNMDSISPHIPMVQRFTLGYDQPTYYPTSEAPVAYGMQTPMHQVQYDQNSMYHNAYNVPQMDQTRAFNGVDANHINTAHQGRALGSSFSQSKVEQPREFGSMDSEYSNNMTDRTYHQPAGYMMQQNFATTAPSVSGFQAPNMLGISEAGFGFAPLSVHAGQHYQQLPMSRAQGSASSYGHSSQNVPQNMPYYGNH